MSQPSGSNDTHKGEREGGRRESEREKERERERERETEGETDREREGGGRDRREHLLLYFRGRPLGGHAAREQHHCLGVRYALKPFVPTPLEVWQLSGSDKMTTTDWC